MTDSNPYAPPPQQGTPYPSGPAPYGSHPTPNPPHFQGQQPHPSYPPPPMPYLPQPAMYPTAAVSLQRQRTSHGLHLFLTIITGGMWGLVVWLPITIWHKVGPRSKTVTRFR